MIYVLTQFFLNKLIFVGERIEMLNPVIRFFFFLQQEIRRLEVVVERPGRPLNVCGKMKIGSS